MDKRTSTASGGRDRRRKRLPGLRVLLINPRRRDVRRSEDRRRLVFLDQYKDSMLVPVVLILVLSATDALLTLFLLNHGAREFNPVMAYFLEKGPLFFVAAKYLLTAVSVTVVVLLNYVFVSFLRLYMHDLLKIFAGLFAAVIAWQMVLIFGYVL
ncbi:MAG: hypothetical protein C4519_25530 [Desulfobacteraceae bacterium]|nr:MAG: hypothetical protein C4519_25530 [Desulfobacteraceae bacterium]